MKRQKTNLIIIFSLAAIVWACSSSPKEIEGQPILSKSASIPSSTFQFPTTEANISVSDIAAEHAVLVKEVLSTERYNYLKVKEGEESFWVAIAKQPIEKDATYLFKGGILKKNFYSQEFDRVFETVYLVSNIRKKVDFTAAATNTKANIPKGEALADVKIDKIELAAGAISLAELFQNRADYSGKKVKITGKCVKLNPKIMNRNWVHLQDGSGEGLDLTITTQETVKLGEIVTLEGLIALDRDFGAGYHYDIIMEGASLQ